MSFIRSLLLIAVCLLSSQARADSYFYDFSYRFGNGTFVEGRFMGDVDPKNSDRLIHVRQVSAWYTLAGSVRTEFNGSGSLFVAYPSAWSDRAYLSFSGRANDFYFWDGAVDGAGTTNMFSILGGWQSATFSRYSGGERQDFVQEFYDAHVLDPATGAVPNWYVGLSPVPEQAEWLALLIGLAAVALRVRRHHGTSTICGCQHLITTSVV